MSTPNIKITVGTTVNSCKIEIDGKEIGSVLSVRLELDARQEEPVALYIKLMGNIEIIGTIPLTWVSS